MPNYFTELKDGPSGPSYKVKDEEAEQAIEAIGTALGNKVDKITGKGLSTNDYSDSEKGKVTANAEAIEAMVNVNGACNILNSSKYFIVNPNSGVTFTVNADGSVTINGTATANTAIVFVFDQIDYDVIMKGSSDDIVINFDPLDGNWQVGTEGQIAHGLNINGFSLNVNNGNTINNVTVYPMLYDARLNPTGYVPYAMTNRELTDELRVNESLVTVVSPYESSANRVAKINNVVFLNYRINNMEFSPKQQQIVGYIPGDLAPSSILQGGCLLFDINGYPSSIGYYRIQTDGTIVVLGNTEVSCKGFIIDIMYIK